MQSLETISDLSPPTMDTVLAHAHISAARDVARWMSASTNVDATTQVVAPLFSPSHCSYATPPRPTVPMHWTTIQQAVNHL